MPVLYHLGQCWWEVSSDREETRAEKALREVVDTACLPSNGWGVPCPLACPLMDDDGGISSESRRPSAPPSTNQHFKQFRRNQLFSFPPAACLGSVRRRLLGSLLTRSANSALTLVSLYRCSAAVPSPSQSRPPLPRFNIRRISPIA